MVIATLKADLIANKVMTAQTAKLEKPPIRKLHRLNESWLITIASPLVKELGVDDLTYFSQELTPEGNLLMKPRKLTA